MNYRVIDMETNPRRDHFNYFNGMANPYAGMTVEVDITDFQAARKRSGRPFFLSFLYCAGRAANHVEQLRQRILDGGIVEFDSCDTSHTVMRENGTYSYCRLNCMQPFNEYIVTAEKLQEEARLHGDSWTMRFSAPYSFPACPGRAIHRYCSPRPSRRTAIRACFGASTKRSTAA